MPDIDRSRRTLEDVVAIADTCDIEDSLHQSRGSSSTYGWNVTHEEFMDILRWELLDRRGECPT